MARHEDPQRWSTVSGDSSEAKAAELLQAMRQAPVPSAGAVARLAHETLASKRRAPARSRWVLVGVVLGVALPAMGVVTAVYQNWARPDPGAVTPKKPAAPPVKVAPVEPEPPVPTESVQPAVVAPPVAPVPRVAKKPVPQKPKAELETALGLESRLLSSALRTLREAKDPRAALALLDDYESKFPHGVLRNEATATRLEAFLALGDRKSALELLVSFAPSGLSGLPRGRELRVLRAELLADEGRCTEALADFEESLDASAADPLAERIMFGRASCWLTLGKRAEGIRELQRYLQLFPKGRFATEVARVLHESEP